jgi:hypothetical protein
MAGIRNIQIKEQLRELILNERIIRKFNEQIRSQNRLGHPVVRSVHALQQGDTGHI